MNYTKGGWYKEGNKIKVFGKGTVAICPSPTDNEGVLEFVPNAHLIAAAPDMYEACKMVFKYACGKNDGMAKRFRITVEQAIAKAEGK